MTTELTVKGGLIDESIALRLPLGALLGAGATAEVYEVKGAPQLALKIARDGYDGILLREARALSLVEGSGAPRLFGLARDGASVRLVIERAPRTSLLHHLRLLEETVPPLRRQEERMKLAVAVLREVGRALLQLHTLGWAHRDIKPENIMVETETGGFRSSVWLIDFGLASDETYVRSGTPLFLPPAVLEGKNVDAARSDAYALCRTLAGLFDERWIQTRHVPGGLAQLPSPMVELLGPVLEPRDSLWPGVPWILKRAEEFGLLPPGTETEPTLRQHYLATRFSELTHLRPGFDIEVSGVPGTWCKQVGGVFARTARLTRGEVPESKEAHAQTVVDLDVHDRGRFLGRVLGPLAASWELPPVSDQVLIERLIALGQSTSLRAVTFRVLSEALRGGRTAGPSAQTQEPCALALALGNRPVATATLHVIAELNEAPDLLLEEAAQVARLSGDLRLAEQLLGRCHSESAQIGRAQLLSRRGDRVQAEMRLVELLGQTESETIRSRVLPLLARYSLDRGEFVECAALLEKAEPSASKNEVEALLALMQGRFDDCARLVDRGLGRAEDPEAKARLFGVRGLLEHSRGDSFAAGADFRRAVDFARSAGAALEEATYLTGVASAASDAGLLSEALDASERAERLFEALDQRAQMARSILARVSVLSVLGAETEVRSLVARGIALARSGGDTRCEAFLLLCACDVSEDQAEKRRCAQLAWDQLTGGDRDDRLSAAARLLEATGELTPEADTWAEQSERIDVCLSWWKARAQFLLQKSELDAGAAAGKVLEHLERVCSAAQRPLSLGPALVAGAHLALRVGRAETARLFLTRADEVARHLLAHVRPAHLASAQALSWVEQARGSRTQAMDGADQLSDVEGLLKALGRRQGFVSLLDQVLDMLLLWTGVERGLLLLRAPGKKLVVRAARNLNRGDLSEEQRQLSFSVAHRAVEEGRPVVLVDAAFDATNLHRSVVSLNLRSVLAVPLVARGEILGVAYLDDRVRRGAFGQRELSWANLIGTVAALAICDERDRLNLRRALRRAERAEQRLSEQLSENELELELAERELSRIKDERKLRGGYENIIGRSRPMRELLSLVDRVAASEVPVLILGESGTGKELIARAIAQGGTRKGKPFIAENCAAVPEALLESTLFGHRRGAFSGAASNQAGLFALADGGTLFLDEVGEMPLSMQSKLLRVLQDGLVRPLGAERSTKVDVRLIVATHRDLEKMVAEGNFRQDLYFRLNVVHLRLPPLRERREDIPLLVRHFLATHGDPSRSVSDVALGRLAAFEWPGNVRQLENEIRRMLVLGGEHLTAADLSPEVLALTSEGGSPTLTLRQKLDALERQLVIEALEQSGGNRTRAAEALGISRFGLQKMTQRLSIDVDSQVQKSGRIRARGLDERS